MRIFLIRGISVSGIRSSGKTRRAGCALVVARWRRRRVRRRARERWETMRADTERRFDRLQAAGRRFRRMKPARLRCAGALRFQVALLDRVQQARREAWSR
jgi:hypothetical protein